jgi:cytochrome c oxidase subunit 2
VNIPNSIWTLLIGIVLTLVSLWYGQNHGLLPTAASEEAVLVDGLFNAMMVASMAIFLIVEGTLIYSAFKFRRRPSDESDGPPVFGNVPLEILWTAIPAIIVIGISIYSFEVYNAIGGFNPHDLHQPPVAQEAARMPGSAIAQRAGTAIAATLSDTPPSTEPNLNQQKSDEARQDPATAAVRNDNQIPQRQNATGTGVVAPTIGPTPDKEGKPPEFVVNVTAMQFAWIFTYPDTGVVTSELHVPVGREVMVNMTANDVIHAFWVPEFRLKQDAIPGMQSEIRFTPNKVGEYWVICAELCGPYHGAMKTKVIVEAPEAFDQWLQEQQVASKETLNQAVAVNPADLTPAQFLAPFTSDMGIQPEMLQQIHSNHHH